MRGPWPVAVVLLALVASARGDDEAGIADPAPAGNYVKVGGELSVIGVRDRGSGAAFGPCATIVHLTDEMMWYGVQADLLLDDMGDADAGVRWTVGPEAGIAFIGGDVSYFGEHLEGESFHGFAMRLKLTVGFVAVYLRYARAVGSDDPNSLELGLQIKTALSHPPRKRLF